MSYYPPYFPDNYLHQMKNFPSKGTSVKSVERIETKYIDKHRLEEKRQRPFAKSKEKGKGIYFDQYV